MRQIVIVLCYILISLLISGCTGKTEYVNIPVKCVVPTAEEPVIDNTKCYDITYVYTIEELNKVYACITTKALHNYLEEKKYAEKLVLNSKVCQ